MSFEDFLHPLLKHYTGSPQWVKSSVGTLYSLLPATVRYGRAYRGFAKELRPMHCGAITKLKEQKLLRTLEWTLQSVPAYAPYGHLLNEGHSPYEILARLPITDKADYKAMLVSYLSTRMPEATRLPTFTGGSTAAPMRFYLHRGVTRSREFAYGQDFDQRCGISTKDVILTMRGRSVPGAGLPGKSLWMYEPIKRQLILSSDHLEARYMAQYLEALRLWKPTCIQAFPSALYPLARWLQDNPAPDVTNRIQTVQLTSENLYDYQLNTMKKVFSCDIIQHYGHSERVLFGATISGDDQYYFWPMYGHLELIDSNGKPIQEPGVLGEIVGTSFDNLVMPFVRYRTGDLGSWAAKPSEQFSGWQALGKIEGRLQEFVVCKDHRLVSITTLGAAHFDDLAQVDAIQFVQHVPGIVTLRIQTPSDLPDHVKSRLERAVCDKTQGGCDVNVECVNKIERTQRGKLKMLEQHIDIAGYLGAAAIE